ncbi:MAG: glycine cleavage system aminomethyltransferase GcvT [Gammaproteobacteria bacterium]|nr:glycine cleavage system aminomethyltransferase GcvT [Gammaproteobacteria bacterium]
MGKRTPLFHRHEGLGAKIVDFGGWDMPIHYGSQIEEHHAVRGNAGVFDVSHMTVVEFHGDRVTEYLERLLANDIKRVKLPGQAMYSAMLNASGGVIDDLIVYATGNPCLAVVNCATRDKDLAWLNEVASAFAIQIVEREDLAILAVQGPNAIDHVKSVATSCQSKDIESLKLFQGCWSDNWFIARTGYTGEKGLEILLPENDVVAFWDALLEAGVSPIGLGARDTLRLEAGMNLYGSDMDESVTPLESNMASTVFLEGRDFIGADALRELEARGSYAELVGLVMRGKGVLRAHYPVFSQGEAVGEITSGAYSPTLQMGIALARVSQVSSDMAVEIRGRMQAVDCVTPPFVRNGKPTYKPLN